MLRIHRCSETPRPYPGKNTLLAAVAMAFASGTAALADSDGSFASRGPGGMQCSALTDMAAGDQAPVVVQQLSLWVSGYVTHFNRSQPGIFDVSPLQDDRALAQVVLNLCKQNPDNTFEAVLDFMMAKLVPWAVTSPSPVLSFTGSAGETIAIREATLTQLQALLTAQSLLAAGAKPGVLDDATQAALRSFQKKNGLPESGLPDASTVLVAVMQQ